MNRLFQLNPTYPVAHAVGALALVCAAGMTLGSVNVLAAVAQSSSTEADNR